MLTLVPVSSSLPLFLKTAIDTLQYHAAGFRHLKNTAALPETGADLDFYHLGTQP